MGVLAGAASEQEVQIVDELEGVSVNCGDMVGAPPEGSEQEVQSALGLTQNISRETDLGLLIRETNIQQTSTADALCRMFIPLGGALVCWGAWCFLPFRQGTTNFPVIEFIMYFVWGATCTIGTTTYLDAVAPAPDRQVICTVLAGAVACPLFWLGRLAITGSLHFNHGFLAYNYVIICAILVPITIWVFTKHGTWQPSGKLIQRLLEDTNEEGPDLCEDDSYQEIVLLGAPRTRLTLGVLIVIFWAVVYATLAAFTQVFHNHDPDDLGFVAWYLGFMVICYLFKSIGKRLGVMADRSKCGTFSLYFSLEFLVSMFYYTFYRSLFEKVNTIAVFVVLQLLHLAFEWVQFAFKTSEAFWKFYDTVNSSTATELELVRATILAPGVRTQRNLQQVVVMEMAIKLTCSVFSAISIIMFVNLTGRVPYLKQQFTTESTEITRFSIFTAIASFSEMINIAIMDKIFFNPRRLYVFQTASLKHFRLRRCSLNCFAVSTTLMINIVYSRMDFS